jgi:hypothetical protein
MNAEIVVGDKQQSDAVRIGTKRNGLVAKLESSTNGGTV